jgi:hypothetical protein
MTATDYLCRHFSRIGARLKLQEAAAFQWEKIRIDISRDRDGEYFDLRCRQGFHPEVLEVRRDSRHLVLMVRDGVLKNKYLLGYDERHWFAAAVPGDSVHDVQSAIASLRPTEVEGRKAIRQGEWFFIPAPDVHDEQKAILRNEPLSRGAGSKPHLCEEAMRRFGHTVMVSRAYPSGIKEPEYHRLLASDPAARQMSWRPMVRDAQVFARGSIRHRDHRTIRLYGWHRVYLNRERFAHHAPQIAFLD